MNNALQNLDRPARHGESWDKDEQKTLYDSYTQGSDIKQCAEAHQRSTGGIRAMLRRLGLIDEHGLDIFPRPIFTHYMGRKRQTKPTTKPEIKVVEQRTESTPEPISWQKQEKIEIFLDTTVQELFDLNLVDMRVFNVLSSNGYKTCTPTLRTPCRTMRRRSWTRLSG